MNAKVKEALIRCALTGLIVGLGALAAIWSAGGFGAMSDYITAAALFMGAAASAVVSWLTTLVGDPDSGKFTE